MQHSNATNTDQARNLFPVELGLSEQELKLVGCMVKGYGVQSKSMCGILDEWVIRSVITGMG